MSHGVLVIEAELRSGTLITSRLATEYNRDVLAVPGPINSRNSDGPNMLIQKGAALITSGEDILHVLDIDPETLHQYALPISLSKNEQFIKDLLTVPLSRDELIQRAMLPTSEINVLLSSLELKGLVRERLGLVEWV